MKASLGFHAAGGFLLHLEPQRPTFLLKIHAVGKEKDKILRTEACCYRVQQCHFSASLLLQTPPAPK